MVAHGQNPGRLVAYGGLLQRAAGGRWLARRPARGSSGLCCRLVAYGGLLRRAAVGCRLAPEAKVVAMTWPPLVAGSLRWPASVGCCGPPAAVGGERGAMTFAECLHAFTARSWPMFSIHFGCPLVRVLGTFRLPLGPCCRYISVALALCGPSVAVLASRLTAPSVAGCFGWLNRRGYAGA